MIPAMLYSGVEPTDARDYTVHACNWPDIAGGYFVGKMAGEPIPYMLYNILFKDGKARDDIDSVEQVYKELEIYYRDIIQKTLKKRGIYMAQNKKLISVIIGLICFALVISWIFVSINLLCMNCLE